METPPVEQLGRWLAVLRHGLRHGRDLCRPLECGQLEALSFALHSIPRCLLRWTDESERNLTEIIVWLSDSYGFGDYRDHLSRAAGASKLAPEVEWRPRLKRIAALLLHCRALPYRAHLEELAEAFDVIDAPVTSDDLFNCFNAMDACIGSLLAWDPLVGQLVWRRLTRFESAAREREASGRFITGTYPTPTPQLAEAGGSNDELDGALRYR